MRAFSRYLFPLLLLISISCLSAAAASAATRRTQSPDSADNAIYVALDGSDSSGDGSEENPYRTLKAATRAAAPGDTIYVRGGLYPAAKDEVSAAGTAGQPITVRPYPNERVVFDGEGANLSLYESVILIRTARHLVFEGFEVRNSAGRGLSAYASEYVTVRNNTVHHTQTRAIGGSGRHLTFEGNEVYQAVLINENGRYGSGGWPGVMATIALPDGSTPADIAFRNNTIHHSWGEGIVARKADGVRIEGNVVHDTYSANIYVDRSENVMVQGNYLYATTPDFNRPDRGYPAHGITLANENDLAGPELFLNHIVIANNLIVRTGRGINFWHDSGNPHYNNTYRNLTIAHNVIMETYSDALHFSAVGAAYRAPSNVSVKNNIFYTGNNRVSPPIGNKEAWAFAHNNWPNGIPGFAREPHTFAELPEFVDPVPGGPPTGYQLKPNSSSIGAGTAVAEVTADFWGHPRPVTPSLGIYEYVTDEDTPDTNPDSPDDTTVPTSLEHKAYLSFVPVN